MIRARLAGRPPPRRRRALRRRCAPAAAGRAGLWRLRPRALRDDLLSDRRPEDGVGEAPVGAPGLGPRLAPRPTGRFRRPSPPLARRRGLSSPRAHRPVLSTLARARAARAAAGCEHVSDAR